MQVDKISTTMCIIKPILTDLKTRSNTIRESAGLKTIPMNQNYQNYPKMAKVFRSITSENKTSMYWKATSRIKSSNCLKTLKSINLHFSEFKVWLPKNKILLKKGSKKTWWSLKNNSLKKESKNSSENRSLKKWSKRTAKLSNKKLRQLKRNSSKCNFFYIKRLHKQM